MARINGTNGRDSIRGTANNDIMHGFKGGDALAGAGGDDTIHGDGGNDSLWGDASRDRLYGGAGDDLLLGGAGRDILRGGAGNDRYIGGDDADRFVFSDVPDSGHTTEYVDDFWFNDVLDFSAIDANVNRDGNQAFRWLGEGDFTGRAGEAVFRHLGDEGDKRTVIFLDTDGNAAYNMSVVLDGFWYGIRPADDYIML